MSKRTCSQSGCERRTHARGLCGTHYAYGRRTGAFTVAPAVSDWDRFWSQVDAEGDCWLWSGNISPDGYGYLSINGHNKGAHVYAWSLLVGEIPPGYHLDHLCRNTVCVNPDHLEPVTRKVNILRGVGPTAKNARKTHCKNNHEFTPENTGIYKHSGGGTYRGCRTCNRERAAKRRAS